MNNITTIVIDPAAMVSMDWLQKEYDAMLDYVRTCPAADAEHPVRIPGEPECIACAQHQANGITLSDQEWANIVTAGMLLGMTEQEFAII